MKLVVSILAMLIVAPRTAQTCPPWHTAASRTLWHFECVRGATAPIPEPTSLPSSDVIASHDFEDATLGEFSSTVKNGTVTVVGAEDGISPYSGTRMVKVVSTTGNGSGLAQVYKALANNPARSATGVYIRYWMLVPHATLVNARSTGRGKDAQIKLNLFRVADQNPAKHSPPAYHGLVIATGTTASGDDDIAVAKDHLNIWVDGATNAIDGSRAWRKRPKYRGGTWVGITEWYQTDGVNSQYKLWFNDRLAKHETFVNTDHTQNRLLGGAPSTTYEARFGMPYFVNRSGVADGYKVYLDAITISRAPIR